MDVHGGKDAAVLVPLFERRRAARGLHAPPPRPAPPRGRDLVPGRPPRRRRGRCVDTALREAHEEVGLPPDAVDGRRRAAADADVRHQLRDLSVRRRDRARLRVGAPAHRGRRGARAVARRRCAPATASAGSCGAASRSARRRYELGRPRHLGRDRPDPRRPAGARTPSRWDVDQVAPLGPRAVVVLDVVAAEQLVQHEPRVRGALADPAVGDDRRRRWSRPCRRRARASSSADLNVPSSLHRLRPRDRRGARDVAGALRALLLVAGHRDQLAARTPAATGRRRAWSRRRARRAPRRAWRGCASSPGWAVNVAAVNAGTSVVVGRPSAIHFSRGAVDAA